MHDGLYLAAESDLSAVVAHIDAVAPQLLVVDSVQTMSTDTADGAPGGVTQVRAVTVGAHRRWPRSAGCRWCWSGT